MMSNKMAKKIAAGIAILLAASMIFSVLASGLAFVSATDSISELEEKLETIEQEKKELQAEMDALDTEIGLVSEKKAALDLQMGLTQDEIDTTQDLIDELELQIADKEIELENATIALEDKTELYLTRTRVMYEQGTSSYLDVILASEDFSDMLTNFEIISQIMAFDKGVVEDFQAAQQEIVEIKAGLESDKEAELTYQGTLEQKHLELETQEKEQQALLDELNSDLEKKQAEDERMDAEKDEINAEVERLSKEAAEKEAAAAAAAAAAGTTYSSSSTVTGSLTWPLPGYGWSCVSSEYGYRVHPIYGTTTMHAGMDLAVPAGTPIVAAASGTVVKSYFSTSYGNYTVINHGGGLMTAYAHQTSRYVSVGDTVSAGETIGTVGTTGNSTGNHLHFEVYVNGSTVNPRNYFN